MLLFVLWQEKYWKKIHEKKNNVKYVRFLKLNKYLKKKYNALLGALTGSHFKVY